MARKRAEEAGRIAPLLLSRFRGSANAGRGRTCAVAATISDVMAMISMYYVLQRTLQSDIAGKIQASFTFVIGEFAG